MRTTGGEGGKCQSSLRGWAGSDSAELEGVDRCSGEFRPLSRPNRARWRRICDRRGAGSRRRRKGTPTRRPAGGPGGGLTGLCRRFPLPQSGESASSAPAGRGGKVPVQPPPEGGKVPVQPPPEGGGKCQFLWRRSAAAGGFEAGRPGGSGDCRSWPGQKLRRCLESGSIRPSASFSSRCRGVSAGRDVAPSGAFAALSPLARLARNPGALGVCDARTMRAADCFVVRVSHEIAVPVGHDRPPVAGRHDVRSAAIWAAPLRVPLLKDPADNHIRLVQLAGGWAGSPSVGNLANINLPIVVHSGDGAAAVGSVLTGNRDG